MDRKWYKRIGWGERGEGEGHRVGEMRGRREEGKGGEERGKERSFTVFGPTVWNSLPLSLRKAQCFTDSSFSHPSVLKCKLVSVCITQEVFVCVCVCLSSLVCVVGLFLCTLMRYIGFMGVLFCMLNWMFQHDCLDTYCF